MYSCSHIHVVAPSPAPRLRIVSCNCSSQHVNCFAPFPKQRKTLPLNVKNATLILEFKASLCSLSCLSNSLCTIALSCTPLPIYLSISLSSFQSYSSSCQSTDSSIVRHLPLHIYKQGSIPG